MKQSEIKEYLDSTDTDDITSIMEFFKKIVSVARESDDMWRDPDFSLYTHYPSFTTTGNASWCAQFSYYPVLPDNSEGEAVIHRAEAKSVLSALQELAEKVVNDERQ